MDSLSSKNIKLQRIETSEINLDQKIKKKRFFKEFFRLILFGLILSIVVCLILIFIFNKPKYQPILNRLICSIGKKYCDTYKINNAGNLDNRNSDVKFYILTQNISQNEYDKKENLVISDTKTFNSVWQAIHKNYKTIPVLPDIDFNHYILLGIFDGLHSTGGYEISVDKIVEQDTNIIVFIKTSISENDCKAISTPTTPYEIIKLSKNSKNIEFQTEGNSLQCLSR